MIRPVISAVVVAHDMERELPRTLQSLSPEYQRGITEPYEVVVVDNGSPVPVAEAQGDGTVRVLRLEQASISPAAAVNAGISAARGEWICVFIDGARIASPGLLAQTLHACRRFERSVVGTFAYHLGPGLQWETMRSGYDRDVEDSLLAGIAWPTDGYRLFEIASLAGSSLGAPFSLPAETNSLCLSRALWNELGGFDERFRCPGGGLVNLDTFARACALPGVEVVMLLGEGTFHQIHGGVATNAERDRWEEFHDEYVSIRGHGFERPDRPFTSLDPVAASPIHASW